MIKVLAIGDVGNYLVTISKYVKKSNIKTTSKIYDEILSLPLFPNISKRHQDAVINCIKSLKNN